MGGELQKFSSNPSDICIAHVNSYKAQSGVSMFFCNAPKIDSCQTDSKLFYTQWVNAGYGVEVPVQGANSYSPGTYFNTVISMTTKDFEQSTTCNLPITVQHGGAGYCEDWSSKAAWDAATTSGKMRFSKFVATGKCECRPDKNAYGEPDPLTWDAAKKLCAGCTLDPPIPLETLIAQYDTTEEAKTCTRKLEAGGNCDNLVKPALLTAKACLQTKMAGVGFTWDGSTTSLFRTRGYQAHFWDLFQKKWTKSGLAKLATDDPSAYKSCTPPPHGVHKNHGLMDTVANPDSVQPHHTTGSAFDVSNDIIRDYKSALKVWAGKHQKDANYKERTITSEAAACGLRWGGNFNDNPHFDLGR